MSEDQPITPEILTFEEMNNRVQLITVNLQKLIKKFQSRDAQMKSLDNQYQQYTELINQQLNEGKLAKRIKNNEAEVNKMISLREKFEEMLDTMNGIKEDLEQKMKELEEQFALLKDLIDRLNQTQADFQDLSQQFIEFQNNYTTIENNLASAKKKITTNSKDINDLKDQIGSLQDEFKRIEAKHDEDIDRIKNETIEQVRQEIIDQLQNDFDAKLKELEENLQKQFDDQLTQLRNDADDQLKKAVAKADKKHKELDNKQNQLEKELNSFQNDIYEKNDFCQTEILRLDNLVTNHEDKINKTEKKLNTELQAIKDKLNEHTNQIQDHDNKIKRLFDMNKKINEEEIQKLQDQINNNKDEFDEFVRKTEESENNINNLIQSNNNKIDQRIKENTSNFEKFKQQVIKNFAINTQQHDEIFDRLTANDQQIIALENDIKDMRDKNDQFQANIENEFKDFNDKSELKFSEAELKADSIRRTIMVRCQTLEEDLNKLKKDLLNVKNETDNDLNKFQHEIERSQDQNKRDFSEFKRETEEVITRMKDEKELIKKEINNWNENQFQQIENKFSSIYEYLNTFSSNDPNSIGTLIEKINKIDNELREKIEDLISEDRLKKELENALKRMTTDVNDKINKILFDLEQYRDQNDLSTGEKIDKLREKINELEIQSSKKIVESTEQNQNDIHENTQKLMILIRNVQNLHKTTDDSFNEFKQTLNDDLIVTKSDIKKMNEAITNNQNDSIKRDNQINDTIKQALEDIQTTIGQNVQKEFQDIRDQLQETSNKYTQSKLIEENLSNSIKDIDSNSKLQFNSIQTKLNNSVDQLNTLFENKVLELLTKIDRIQSLYDVLKGDTEIDFPMLVKNFNSIQEQLEIKFNSCNQSINKTRDNLLIDINKLRSSYILETTTIKQSVEDLRTDSAKNLAQTKIEITDKFNSASNEIRQKLTNLIKQFNEFIGVDKIKISDILTMIQKVRTDFESSDSMIAQKVQENDDYLQEQIAQLSTQLVQYSEQVERMFKSMKNKTDEKFKKVQEELEKCIQKIRDLLTQMNDEMARISDNGKLTLPLIVTHIEELTTSTFDSFTKAQDSMKDLYNSLKEQLKKLKSDVGDIKDSSLTDLNTRLEKNENELIELKNNQEDFIETSNATFHQNTLKNETKIIELEEVISSFEKKLENQIEDVKTTATTTDETNQKQFTEILQQIGNIATSAENKSKKRKKKILDKLNSLNDSNSKNNEDISVRQNHIESKLEENEKKIENELNQINEKLIDKIGYIENLSAKNVDEKSAELREKIRVIEEKIRDNANLANESINSALEFYKDETNHLKIEITKIKGESNSNSKNSLGNESIATLSQIIRKMRDSNESRFKSIEDRNLVLNETINKNQSEMSSKLLNGDKTIQSQVDQLTIRFQNLENNMNNSNENATKDLTERYAKLEHLINKNEASFNDTIELIQTRLDTTIQANESNSKANFERIDSQLLNISNTVNNDREKAEKLVNLTAQRIDEYFKKDNESIRQTIAELTEKLSKRSTKIVDACNKKFSEIDELAALMTSNQENSIISIKVLIENTESKLKEMISITDKSLNDNCMSLTHKIDLINQQNEEIQKVLSKNEEIEKKDFLKLQNEINNNQVTNNAALDQMMSVVKTHLDKRKQEIKKLGNKIQLEMQQVIEEITNSNSQIQKNALMAKENLDNSIAEVKEDNLKILNDQKEVNSNLSKKIKEISLDISTRINPSFIDFNNKIDSINIRIDNFDDSFRNHQVKMNSNFIEIDEQFNTVNNLIENSKNLLKDKIENEKKALIDKNDKTLHQIELVAADHSKTQSRVSTIEIEIEDLKRVHFYNAEIEAFSIKFEEVLAYIEKNKEEICNFVHASFLGSSLLSIKGDPLYTEATVEKEVKLSEIQRVIQVQSKLNKSSDKDGSKVIENLKDEMEIGRIIRDELKTNIAVKVIIPKSTRVLWNKTVQISPHQKVTILGEDKETSIIQMNGLETFGGVPINLTEEKSEFNDYIVVCDPSRCLIDGFGSLFIKNVRIEANCTTNKNEQVDLRSLFVCRGWDAIGPSLVHLSNCVVNSDHSVVNVGGNAFVHIQFDQCRITNCGVVENSIKNKKKEKENEVDSSNKDESEFEIIYPVMAESGPYPDGYGVIADNGTVLAGKGIQWMKSLYLLNSESRIE